MIDLSALTYVAIGMLASGGFLAGWARVSTRRLIGELIAVLGLALLCAAASRWWGSAELESAALVVFAIAALRTSDSSTEDG